MSVVLGTKARDIACSRCKRAPGEPCIWQDGTEIGFHRERIRDAAERTRNANKARKALSP